MSKPPFVRRASHIVCYWENGRLVLHNYRTGSRFAADPLACQILDFFDDWHSTDDLVAELSEYRAPSVRKAVRELIACSMLERRDVAPTASHRAFETWRTWNPAAGFFHMASKDVAYGRDPEAMDRELVRRAKREAIPPPVKRYRGATRIALPAPRTDGQFARVLLARRTWRRFAKAPLEFSHLGTLLGLTCAVQYWVDLRGLDRVPLKTSPSGGAVHALETYVVARRVNGLASGLYHYASDVHQLERLKRGATTRLLSQYIPGQRWFRSAAALLLFTAVFPRKQWKYGYSRAYRTLITESGHLCQTFCLVATWLGLAPFCTLALADSRIERDLGLDGISESVLYAAGVGVRRSGDTWGPFPSGRTPTRRPGPLSALRPPPLVAGEVRRRASARPRRSARRIRARAKAGL